MPNTVVLRPPFRRRGQAPWFFSRDLERANVTGAGGVKVGGAAGVAFVHGGQVASDIVVEWDLDNDGDFGETVEDITPYVLAAETLTGRDWPSQLTGKAGPGHLRLTLRNDDDRFSYFNTASPLATAPFSLRTGRKMRIRTASASNPDPVLLARDRFRRADGAIGTEESGLSWSGPLANDFTIASQKAVAATAGAEHIAVVDVSATAYYVQATIAEVGSGGSTIGIVYRYQDVSNYSLAVVDVTAEELQLVDVVAGTPSTVASETVEPYDGMTIGVLVSGTDVTFYHEGVAVFTGTAVQTDETEVGIYAERGAADSFLPKVSRFDVWAGLPAQVEGILWTGDVSDLSSSVTAGPQKLATVQGHGWLSRLAGQRVSAMASVNGKKTGVLVGEVLAAANLLHPPGWIDEGDITTGPFGADDSEALEAARRFEDAEYGFLYESQEGPLSFDSRTARSASTVQATFTDAAGGQFGYHRLAPLDWRREVFNRVIAGVAPALPAGITLTADTYTDEPVAVVMPATVDAGDLLLVNITIDSDVSFSWTVPPGWTEYNTTSQSIDDTLPNIAAGRLFAKVADGTEDSTTVTFTSDIGPSLLSGYAVSHLYRVTDWFGSLDGVAVGEVKTGSNPDFVAPTWGRLPSLFLAFRHGTDGSGITVSGTTYPARYAGGTSTTNTRVAVQSAYRLNVTPIENPGTFGGTFTGFGNVDTITVAVRGYNGDPPLASGVETVQVDDTDSQDEHNAIRTYRNDANLFVDATAADTWADLVIATHADDRPILELGFYPVKSAAYRAQAVRRRVGDKVTVVATGNAGLGVSQDFFIEAIGHRWSNGTSMWETTWTLSPA